MSKQKTAVTVTNKRAKGKRAKRVADIGSAAVTLGVTREHLSRVIHGSRVSPKLRARFDELQKLDAEMSGIKPKEITPS